MYYNAECCKHCSNNPANNPFASGWCACTLPYMEQYKTPIDTIDTKTYTYQTSDWSNIVNINENKYRRKSTEIEAIQFSVATLSDIIIFTECTNFQLTKKNGVYNCLITVNGVKLLLIEGNYVTKNSSGDINVVTAEVFEASYIKKE